MSCVGSPDILCHNESSIINLKHKMEDIDTRLNSPLHPQWRGFLEVSAYQSSRIFSFCETRLTPHFLLPTFTR